MKDINAIKQELYGNNQGKKRTYVSSLTIIKLLIFRMLMK